MILPKAALSALTGTLYIFLVALACIAPLSRANADGGVASAYVDVPAGHPAAKAVADLKSKGIVSGYPGNAYRGSDPVTRYELAVILYRFAKYYDQSKQPLTMSKVSLPAAPAWVEPARQYLASNRFVSSSSPIFSNPGSATVTADQLAAAVSSLMDRLNDRSLPPTKH